MDRINLLIVLLTALLAIELQNLMTRNQATADDILDEQGDPIPPEMVERQRSFKAYDCSDPRNIRDVNLQRGKVSCAPTQTKSFPLRNVTYHILQKEDSMEMAGWRCKGTISRKAMYCGHYDHQTLFSKGTHDQIPLSISHDQCYTMFAQQAYKDDKGKAHPVERDRLNVIKYIEIGREWAYENEIHCEGGKLIVGDQQFNDMMVYAEMHLYFTKERFINQQGFPFVPTLDLTLPCPLLKVDAKHWTLLTYGITIITGVL